MEIIVTENYEGMSRYVAEFVIECVRKKPESLLSLAAGTTPTGALRYLSDQSGKGNIDFSECRFVGLDEWVGLSPNDSGSCKHLLDTEFFIPSGIKESQISFFDALADNLEGECTKANAFINANGGIDLMVVGLGMNGHIGFNEPGVSTDLYAHIIELNAVTKFVGQKYFKTPTSLHKGITLGLRHVMEAKTVIMMIDGRHKAEILREAVEGDISSQIPASILKGHPRSYIIAERNAACLLKGQ